MTARGREVEVPLFSKAPFANYDLVVYLGAGLFGAILFYHYIIVPFALVDTDVLLPSAEATWPFQALFLISAGVLSYVSGHLVAYLSSHYIEGFLNKAVGSFSNVVRMSTEERTCFEESLREEIDNNRKGEAKFKGNWFLYILHLFFLPWYWAVKKWGLFSALDTRIPKRMIEALDQKLGVLFGNVSTSDARQWFRWVEYYSFYNAPTASASMYNYLIISGFMRSVSLILLLVFWAMVLNFVNFVLVEYCNMIPIFEYQTPALHSGQSFLGWIVSISLVGLGYVCALTTYVKFYRRYVEEAILGFLLEVPPVK